MAVTPDELGVAWQDGRVCLPIRVSWNGREFGRPDAAAMGFGFHELIAHAAYSRNLSAGTIIGSGTVSNANYRVVGSGCIAERRAIELADRGRIETEYMRFGDRVRIEMLDAEGPAFSERSTKESCRRIRRRRADDSRPRKSATFAQAPSTALGPGGPCRTSDRSSTGARPSP